MRVPSLAAKQVGSRCARAHRWPGGTRVRQQLGRQTRVLELPKGGNGRELDRLARGWVDQSDQHGCVLRSTELAEKVDHGNALVLRFSPVERCFSRGADRAGTADAGADADEGCTRRSRRTRPEPLKRIGQGRGGELKPAALPPAINTCDD